MRTLDIDAGQHSQPSTDWRPAAKFDVHLTKREIEVLALISQGYSNKEAADALYVSKRTVDFHLNNVYPKLKAKNRIQAFRVAVLHGLLPPEPV